MSRECCFYGIQRTDARGDVVPEAFCSQCTAIITPNWPSEEKTTNYNQHLDDIRGRGMTRRQGSLSIYIRGGGATINSPQVWPYPLVQMPLVFMPRNVKDVFRQNWPQSHKKKSPKFHIYGLSAKSQTKHVVIHDKARGSNDKYRQECAGDHTSNWRTIRTHMYTSALFARSCSNAFLMEKAIPRTQKTAFLS